MPSCRRSIPYRFVRSKVGGGRFFSTNNARNSQQKSTAVPPYIWATLGGTAAVLVHGYISGLDEVPVTKRKRWMAVSPQLETKLGNQEYHKLLRHFQKDILPPTHRASRTVKRVGSRVGDAAIQFASRHNLQNYASESFTFTVVRSDTANAFVLPGNHVFIMTGLFQYVKNEDELAAILGHEMAHTLARHAGEKMSESFAKNILIQLTLLLDPSGVFASIFLPAATLLRDLPHSRQMEIEADQIGIQLAAQACFDPTAAKHVFQSMAKTTSGKEPPEFLSTHPAHDSRIDHLDHCLPEANKIYLGNGEDGGMHRCRVVRQQMKEARRVAAAQ